MPPISCQFFFCYLCYLASLSRPSPHLLLLLLPELHRSALLNKRPHHTPSCSGSFQSFLRQAYPHPIAELLHCQAQADHNRHVDVRVFRQELHLQKGNTLQPLLSAGCTIQKRYAHPPFIGFFTTSLKYIFNFVTLSSVTCLTATFFTIRLASSEIVYLNE